MENIHAFNLQEFLDNWCQNLKNQESFTDADIEELKYHLLDIVNDLTEKGLDEEEACIIATKRLGSDYEWKEFEEANNSVIQLRKSVMLLSGVIAYFFVYYLVLVISKIFLGISLVAGMNVFTAVDWVGRYLVSIHFLLIICTVSLYFLEDRVVSFLDRFDFQPKKVVYFLLITFLTALLEINIYPAIKNMFGGNIAAISYLYKDYQYFKHIFPLLVCICFFMLYLRFNKKNSE